MLRKKTGLTKQETIFVNEYIKTLDGLKALNIAYPSSVNWTYNAQHVQVNKLLNKPKIDLKIKEHNERESKALANSTLLNKRKILNEIIRQYSETAENGASERTNSVALLKLLAQISKLLDNGGGSTNLQVNIQNNAITTQVSDYLNL